MSREKRPITEDLRFDLGADSDGEDVPPASTLYDPAILALSPELRAKVAARKDRDRGVAPDDSTEVGLVDDASPFHIMSPTADVSKRPFQDGEQVRKQILVGNGMETAVDSNELELCFCGLIPVYPALLIIHAVTMITGAIVIIIGAQRMKAEGKPIAGFGSADSFLISGVFLAGAVYVTVGLLLMICGMLGATLAFQKWRHPAFPRRILELVHQCLLVMLTLLSLVLFVVMSIALSITSKRRIYDKPKWSEIAQAEPVYTCSMEKRLGCSGFDKGQCEFDGNETSISFCPGHFCIDFCKVATDDVNIHSLCEPCQADNQETVTELISCKAHEKAETGTSPCEMPVNNSLERSYRGLLVASLVCLIWIVITISSASYNLCCGY